MNTYPVDAIREYRSQLQSLEIEAEACDGCESGGWLNVNDPESMCTEHAAVRAAHRYDLRLTR